MSKSYVVLVRAVNRRISRNDLAADEINNGITSARKLGIKISNLYWTQSSYHAVLVLQAEDEPCITHWKENLKNLHIRIIPTVQGVVGVNQTTAAPYGLSCDMIHWWY